MDLAKTVSDRVNWIKMIMEEAGAKGIVLGMSGGKDCALVGILAKQATPNVTGIIMPCDARSNYLEDMEDAKVFNELYDIQTRIIDLTPIKKLFRESLYPLSDFQPEIAYENMNPRLRMIALYNYAQREGYLVAGTGNLSERTIGYFTKWGDGAYDFNPIGDLTVTEVYEMLKYLDCPDFIINKKPSAGLYDGQTDEQDIGLSYAAIDSVIRGKTEEQELILKINKMTAKTAHKRKVGRVFPN